MWYIEDDVHVIFIVHGFIDSTKCGSSYTYNTNRLVFLAKEVNLVDVHSKGKINIPVFIPVLRHPTIQTFRTPKLLEMAQEIVLNIDI